jgi:ribosomal protein S30
VVANLKQIEPAENKDETHRGKKTQIYNKRIEKCQRTKVKPTKEKNPDLQQTT